MKLCPSQVVDLFFCACEYMDLLCCRHFKYYLVVIDPTTRCITIWVRKLDTHGIRLNIVVIIIISRFFVGDHSNYATHWQVTCLLLFPIDCGMELDLSLIPSWGYYWHSLGCWLT
jgi:hypothetical protein